MKIKARKVTQATTKLIIFAKCSVHISKLFRSLCVNSDIGGTLALWPV